MENKITSSIHGTFQRVLWREEETAFTLFTLHTKNRDEYTSGYGTYVVKGYIPLYPKGTPLTVIGSWQRGKNDKGPIMSATSIVEKTTSRDDVVSLMLAVGMKQTDADKMGNACKSQDLFRIISASEFEMFCERAELGARYARELRPVLMADRTRRQILDFLQAGGKKAGLKIPYAAVNPVYRSYGENAIYEMEKRPFEALSLAGLSFRESVAFVKAMGMAPEANGWVSSIMTSILKEAEGKGDTYIERGQFESRVKAEAAQAGFKMPMIDPKRNKLIVWEDDGDASIVCSQSMWSAESKTADLLSELLKSGHPLLTGEQIEAAIERLENDLGISYAPAQKDSFNLLRRSGIGIVTGGPGTGKTTVLNGLLRAYEMYFPENKIVLAAPTGRAAQRMSESTGRPASTIHRLIKLRPGELVEEGELDADLLVIDESSMVDAQIMSLLAGKIRPGALLLLVGDVNQLPSVGAGDILHDLIGSGYVPVCKLQTVYRQSGDSLIVKNANNVNEGIEDLEEDDTFTVMQVSDAKDIVTRVKEWVGKLMSDSDSDPFAVQVLVPSHEGKSGVKLLNKELQQMLNPRKDGTQILTYGEVVFRVGDKVITTSNNYALGYLNGDLGIIENIDSKGMTIDISGNSVLIDRQNISDVSLAYAITIHKSQGSEFQNVIVAMACEPRGMLKRNLLYTAITRGKKRVVIVAENGATDTAINTIETGTRATRLIARIKGRGV